MSEKNKKPILRLGNILIFILAIIAIAFVFVWIKSGYNDEKQALEKDISDLEGDIDFYERAQQNYTPTAVNKKINKDKINVNKSFRQKKIDIEDGITRVYDQTDNQEDYNNIEEDVEDDLGEQFSKKLAALSSPKISEAGEEQFPHEKLEDVKIAFGDYDIVNHTAKTFVLVDYEAPKTGANNPGVDREDKQVAVGGRDLFTLNFDLEDDSLTLDDYQGSKQSEEVSDD